MLMRLASFMASMQASMPMEVQPCSCQAEAFTRKLSRHRILSLFDCAPEACSRRPCKSACARFSVFSCCSSWSFSLSLSVFVLGFSLPFDLPFPLPTSSACCSTSESLLCANNFAISSSFAERCSMMVIGETGAPANNEFRYSASCAANFCSIRNRMSSLKFLANFAIIGNAGESTEDCHSLARRNSPPRTLKLCKVNEALREPTSNRSWGL
mmetsp:Transcript_39112/g.101229  ORF Transcript_39112/g.101229 Transcript_39112/m.101229 type:complete len:212 (+) Transcript_39112:3188-3823(+)